ncbi:MAG: heme lyase CcmF/NrfE family subunit [Rubrivivax sp.]|nr:heme lyase CcmF/NrfE family subunit [Rubrivivax sp.]
MIPEFGHFLLWLALGLSLILGVVPLAGAQLQRPGWMALARPGAVWVLLLVAASYLALTIAFMRNDFSVLYVAQNSNTALPMAYKIAAVWGGHEGSLLLWILMLVGWMAAVAGFSRHLPLPVLARIVSVMALVSVGFMLFTLLTSNPFDRLFPAAPDGRDLNPLLQDPGMIFHPPLLYMGYVGFSVAFAFAVAALIGGNLDAQWARWTRPWTTVAWMFLTVGIALGSWWAYYELGWGGWWFWDPVENASFMPWLVGTALIHSLAVTEKRGSFKSWTVLLAIMAFSLSLLGTFLVRSGVLSSVHAFATDPTRGLFILGFLVVYPLVLDALGKGKISVGPPYFDAVFAPLMAPVVFLMGVGPMARWKQTELPDLAIRLRWAALVAVLATGLSAWIAERISFMSVLGLLLGWWIVASVLTDLWERVSPKGQGLGLMLRRTSQLTRATMGMMVAHLGVAVFIFGVTIVKTHEVERDVKMKPGDYTTIGNMRFTLREFKEVQGPNYQAVRGLVDVTDISRGDRLVARMEPEKRVYRVQTMPMTEAAIRTGLLRDLYVSLGEPVEGGAWIVRLYVKPFVDWIWGGCVLMALGGLLAATDRRYRQKKTAQEPATTSATAAA